MTPLLGVITCKYCGKPAEIPMYATDAVEWVCECNGKGVKKEEDEEDSG